MPVTKGCGLGAGSWLHWLVPSRTDLDFLQRATGFEKANRTGQFWVPEADVSRVSAVLWPRCRSRGPGAEELVALPGLTAREGWLMAMMALVYLGHCRG